MDLKKYFNSGSKKRDLGSETLKMATVVKRYIMLV